MDSVLPTYTTESEIWRRTMHLRWKVIEDPSSLVKFAQVLQQKIESSTGEILWEDIEIVR